MSAVRARARFADSLFVRLLAVLLVTSVPVVLLLAGLLTGQASQSLTASGGVSVTNLAIGASSRLDTWLTARQGDMIMVAASVRGHLHDTGPQTLISESDYLGRDFASVEVVAADGSVIFSTAPAEFQASSEPWFASSLAAPLITPLKVVGLNVFWNVTAPVLPLGDTSASVVIGELKLTHLSEVFTRFAAGGSTEIHLLEQDRKLIYSSAWGTITNDAELVNKGILSVSENSPAVSAGLAGNSGAVRTTDYRGLDVISGYAPVPSIGWVVIASQLSSAVLAPISNQILIAVFVTLLAIVLTTVIAVMLARWVVRPVRALSAAAAQAGGGDLTTRVKPMGALELRQLAERFNAMIAQLEELVTGLRDMSSHATDSATKLSSAAEELASATTEQTSAATETSASMEELARTSMSIAETLERLSVQAQETKENLQQAQADMQASGVRTVALAGRVNDINEILTLINEIADQTNLLALNAAIEAARAGDAGRGFAVVADEVRRLAERSKTSAGKIAKIIDSARTESNATVMAIEQSSKQMDRGLRLLDDVVEASSHVQLITQQQRTATDQVVEAMEQIAVGSRQVATTAHEISQAAAGHAGLATELEMLSGNGSKKV
jgi:methyl-accepting chemotaxis protein